jgi:XTP/dITP diphosphohydrolase
MKLVCASANPDKVAEMTELLSGVDLLPRPSSVPDVVEDADTYLGNARLKAVAIADAAGAPAVSDDSGLEVDALDGAPGVHSARFAGPDATYAGNVDRLLRDLEGVPAERRTARFRCVVMVRWPDGREAVAEGVVEGRIATERRGVGGFGYDPVFIPDEGDGRSFGEMTPEEKHALSHRGRALRALAEALAHLPDEDLGTGVAGDQPR